jgi:hypothetical protein
MESQIVFFVLLFLVLVSLVSVLAFSFESHFVIFCFCCFQIQFNTSKILLIHPLLQYTFNIHTI